ncbi:MAG: hypothetical protein LQ351_003293 [Letrouitia transgressa]|nr:MAG: hypothetical protein LQ351_003293 [Letrouitia transgressa]
MDKTVRLWHVSRSECLCCFKHSDFVTSIQFHPQDDRFFLAGSLDSKLRLWSIPDKSVAFWNQLPELITAVAFSPDGKTAIAGLLNGLCLVYETEGLKPQTQIHVKSTHGKNAKGSKITGIQTIDFPPEDANGEVKVLITSNDSRVRIYNLRDKALEVKLKGNQNSCSQIHASFSDDARYVICGSEDRKAYIWSTGPPETEKDRRSVEMFEAHSAIVTNAIMAPIKTKQLLGGSGDPLYDLCNPPAVTLVSRSESHSSSRPPTENGNIDGSFPPTPAITTSEFEKPSKPEESQAYITRSAHPGGNVIVTADYMGHIKVFRQDCAYQKRLRNDANFSRKMLGRTNSVATRSSRRSKRDSFVSTPNPSSDRILSWRQSIANSSIDNVRRTHPRSTSPRKSSLRSPGHTTGNHSSPAIHKTPSISTTSPSRSLHRSSNDDSKIHNPDPSYPALNPDTNPLMLQGDHSYMFWSKSAYQNQAQAATHNHLAHQQNATLSARSSVASSRDDETDRLDPMTLGVPVGREASQISALSSDKSEGEGEGAEEMTCRRCGGRSFRARGGGKVLSCGSCGEIV